ncbi:hypothetical protein [Niabella terrae]
MFIFGSRRLADTFLQICSENAGEGFFQLAPGTFAMTSQPQIYQTFKNLNNLFKKSIAK